MSLLNFFVYFFKFKHSDKKFEKEQVFFVRIEVV